MASKGWAVQLAEYYMRRSDVVNRGFSGYTARYAQLIAPYALSKEDLERAYLVTIWFGANDAVIPSSRNPQHVPLAEYEKHLEHIVITIKERAMQLYNSNLRIILITPLPVDEKRRIAFLSSTDETIVATDRTNQMIECYADICRHVAQRQHISCLCLYNAMMESVDYSIYLQEDGLHLSTKGNQFVFDLLKELIERDQHQISPDQLEFIYPLYTNIDPENLLETLIKPIQ